MTWSVKPRSSACEPPARWRVTLSQPNSVIQATVATLTSATELDSRSDAHGTDARGEKQEWRESHGSVRDGRRLEAPGQTAVATRGRRLRRIELFTERRYASPFQMLATPSRK